MVSWCWFKVPKPSVKGRSSERIAIGILERLDYEILETNRIVSVDESEAFEVDIIALSPEGEKFCVEVKAGQASVSDIRQVFADSEVLGLKPMLVCKGFANEAAEAIAKKLDVKMIPFSQFYVLLEPEELEVVVRSAVQDVLNEYGFFPLPLWEAIKEEDWSLIENITTAESFKEAAQYLDLSVEDLGRRIGDLRKRGIFPGKGQSFMDLKRHSQLLVQRFSLVRRLDKIEESLKKIGESLDH